MRRATTAANAILSATVLVALIASPLARADPDAPTTPVVTTTAGMVQGEVVDGIYTFKGIPYAADTGGANRWTAPKDPEAWSDVRDATTFMDVCPQGDPALDPNVTETVGDVALGHTIAEITGDDGGLIGAGNGSKMSEDCLGLNVYAPALDEKLPVMVWIYGGALQSGTASTYPGEVLAKKGDVVVVTINYRLGFLGYFAHPELSEANFGLLDQVKALEWVRDNIESFGGDPSKVTIFGESAGGTSVLALMASPLSEGLFQRVISESASVDESPNVTVSEGGKLGVAVGEHLGLPAGAGQLEKMRETSFEELVDAEVEMITLEYYLKPTILYVDNKSLPSCVFCAFKEGSIHQVDLMIGSNNNESSIMNFLGNVSEPSTTSAYEQAMENVFGENAKEVLSLFPGSPDSDAFATKNLIDTAGIYGAPAFFAANKSSDLGNPTFLYNFRGTVAPLRGTAQNEEYNSLGAFHGLELNYLWAESVPNTDLVRDMQKYWTTFARTGNPNAESLPEWKAFEGAHPSWMVLSDDKIGSEPVPEDMQALYAIINNDIYPDWDKALFGGDHYAFAANTTDA